MAEDSAHGWLCGLTFELRRDQRQDARPGLAKMYAYRQTGPSGLPLGLASSEGLGSTVGGSGKVRSVPPVLLTLENQNNRSPLRADKADPPRSCPPPRTKLNEATALRTAACPKN